LAVLALQPGLAEANLEEGHPEFYSNNVRVAPGSRVGTEQSGVLYMVTEGSPGAQNAAELQCNWLGFGYVTNEGTPAFGKGQLLSWQATGDILRVGGPMNWCKYIQQGIEGEVDMVRMTDEPLVEGRREAPLSVPWNFELVCVEREGVKSALIRIGVPNNAPAPAPGCKTEAARGEEIAGEEERREGCFATAVPEGCIKLNVVVPFLFERILEGSLELPYKNGFANGLHPSTWTFEGGPANGQLHERGVFQYIYRLEASATAKEAVVKNVGFGGLQLVTMK
jgi:hypothetical protein